MADEETKEEEGGGGGGSKLPLIGGIAVVALLIGGGGGYAAAAMLDPGDEVEVVDGEVSVEGVEEEVSVSTERAVHPLEPFLVNLRGSGGGRMLRLEVHLEVSESDLETLTARDAVVRDAVLALASDQTYSDLEGLDGKTFLRDELLRRLNSVLDGPRIERVYFTDFVVQ